MSSEDVFDGVLDLTGADESAGKFDAIPAGTYVGHVHQIDWKQTSNPDGTKKLADGTPYMNVQLAIDSETASDGSKVQNRRVFTKLFNPAEGTVPPDKLAYHRGTMLNFLLACGLTKDEISKKGFRLDPETLYGQQLSIIVSRVKNSLTGEWDNDVKGVKPLGDRETVSGLV